ncbi:Carboxylic ester hydrolase [Mycena chlorophos]|uniref:Carboxylic ester hydrolase n=1 Tax=Mycena chlorophos TaxID=658473 RepID=A0A8H6SUY9_MYCCL|nr:Carboxylic ester hydrolase [Mycena chlorophos]
MLRSLLGVLSLSAFAHSRSVPRSTTITSSTPLGTAQGILDTSGATRYAVRYATAERWQESVVATNWQLPNDFTDPGALPLQCPQLDADDSTFSEDCLSILLYVPPRTPGPAAGNLNTLVWIHGGSFDSGSATGTGLDGSNLAVATNAIVAVLQYRLGALALLAPNGPPNLSVLDTMNAIKFLGQVLPSFGGTASAITLAGQSSGAGMIRTLLATPSAQSLFKSAILQSDPMDYGFLSTATQTILQDNFNSQLPCAATNTSCLSSLSVNTILSAYSNTNSAATSLAPSTGLGEPIRPVLDGTLVTSRLDSTAPFPATSKPLLLTTVLNDAGPTIYNVLFPGTSPVPADFFAPTVEETLGDERAQTVVDSSYYPIDPNGDEDARVPLQLLGTDYIWRCAVWTFAREWVGNGATGLAWVGVFEVGATYPDNEDIPYCLEEGVVCHEDDIEIVFGTVPSPTAAQAALTLEIQTRYRAFLENADPNVPGLATWSPATTDDVNALPLGGNATAVDVGACTPSFWGDAVQYDYQFYDI